MIKEENAYCQLCHQKLPLSMEAPTLSSLLTRKIINYNHSGRMGQKIKYLIVHDTGNARSGAGASAHQKYFGSGNKNASAHYLVDSKEIIQIVDDSLASWHCGDGHGKKGITNQNSIGIELCINKDGCLCKTLDHAAILIKNLAKKYKIPKENILRHYDASRKICPRSLSSDNWQKWTEFKNKI